LFNALVCSCVSNPTARCTAYEDAELGMQSARAAGMTVVDVRLLEGYPSDDYKAAA
jgi:beta-phosphoglucomutase-like phosphatase (HAD superfamily)